MEVLDESDARCVGAAQVAEGQACCRLEMCEGCRAVQPCSQFLDHGAVERVLGSEGWDGGDVCEDGHERVPYPLQLLENVGIGVRRVEASVGVVEGLLEHREAVRLNQSCLELLVGEVGQGNGTESREVL